MSHERPNILLLMSDQHNHRYFSYLNEDERGEPVQTPTLDGLARSGVIFEQSYCAMPLCTPSRLCLLTGREVRNAGAWGNESMLPPGLPTLPGTLSDEGYRTCLQGKMHLGGSRQFVGFDHRPYGDLTGKTGHQVDPPVPGGEVPQRVRSRTADAGVMQIPESLLQERNVSNETIAFVREHAHARPQQPWFVCASFSRPHWPRTAPHRYIDRYWPDQVTRPAVDRPDRLAHPFVDRAAREARADEIDDDEMMRARAAYFACVDFLDEIIGDLLATLDRDGLLENTIVVYAGDHGELAGEHGLWEKRTWHEDSTRVPWFVQLPEHRSGDREPSRLSEPVSLIDLYPTICGLVDASVPDAVDGVDLSNAVETGGEPDRGPVFCDNFERLGEGEMDYRMVRDGEYKYVQFRNAPELLFDVEADPLERRNLAEATDTDALEALDRLRDLVDETMDFDAVDEKRRRDRQVQRTHRLGIPKGTGNAYHLPGGTVVDADTPLYHPHVLAEEPEIVFDDFPS